MIYISPEHLSYIIGFLQGDGNNYVQSRNRGKIDTEISIRDRDILDKIGKCLNGLYIGHSERKRNTNFKDNYTSSRLSLYDLETRRFLSRFIPVGKKADKVKPPDKENFFNKYAYIRGLFEADGSIGMTSQNRPFWSLCTSSEFVKTFILQDIQEVLNFEKRINRNKRDNIYNIVLYDEEAVEYAKLMYKDATIFLNRKHAKFLELLKWKRSIPKRKSKKKTWLPYEDIVILDSSVSLKDKMLMLRRSKQSISTRLWRLRQ